MYTHAKCKRVVVLIVVGRAGDHVRWRARGLPNQNRNYGAVSIMANANGIARLVDQVSLTLTGISELGDVLSDAVNDGGQAQRPWAFCLVFKLLAEYAQIQLDQVSSAVAERCEGGHAES